VPKQINTYFPGQQLVQRFGLKGRFQPVLDEVVVPVTILEPAAPQERIATGGAGRGASGAGNQNQVYLENPAGSGIVVKVTGFLADSGSPVSDGLNLTLVQGTAGATSATAWRDSGLWGIPKAKVAGANVAAAVLGVPFYPIDDPSAHHVGPWILEPNSYLRFVQNAQNVTLLLTIFWTETDITEG
jgi:hypothetical protein